MPWEYRRERRRFKRGYQSCRVRFGPDSLEHEAKGRRITPGGLFIATNKIVYAEGMEINMEIEIDDKTYRAVGLVRHALKVDPRLTMVVKAGMGVEFIEVDEDLIKAIGK